MTAAPPNRAPITTIPVGSATPALVAALAVLSPAAPVAELISDATELVSEPKADESKA